MNRLLREKAKLSVAKFVIKNFSPEGERIVGKKRKKAIRYHLARVIGNKDNIVVILKENEGFLEIDEEGNIVDVTVNV